MRLCQGTPPAPKGRGRSPGRAGRVLFINRMLLYKKRGAIRPSFERNVACIWARLPAGHIKHHRIAESYQSHTVAFWRGQSRAHRRERRDGVRTPGSRQRGGTGGIEGKRVRIILRIRCCAGRYNRYLWRRMGPRRGCKKGSEGPLNHERGFLAAIR